MIVEGSAAASEAEAQLWIMERWTREDPGAPVPQEMRVLAQSVPAAILRAAYWLNLGGDALPEMRLHVQRPVSFVGAPSDVVTVGGSATLVLRPLSTAIVYPNRHYDAHHVTVDMALPSYGEVVYPHTAWIELARPGVQSERLRQRLCRSLTFDGLAWHFAYLAFIDHRESHS